MKLIIEIPEDRYDEIHSLKFVMYGLQSEENKQLFYRLINAVQDGTPIPDNATNGEVIKAIFPNTVFAEDKYECEGIPWVDIFSDDMTIEMDFWNAPYQKGGKE